MKRLSKIILIFSIIAIALVIIYFGWQYLFTHKGVSIKTASKSVVTIPKLQKLSDNSVFDYWLNSTGDIYFIAKDGQIAKIDSSGQVQNLESKAMGLISSVKASNDGSSILVEFGYPQAPTFAVHNLVNKTWQSLPQGTVAAAWDPKSSNRLIYLKDSGLVSRLYFYTVSSGKSVEIFHLAQKDLDLDWAAPDTIYFTQRPSSQSLSSMWSFGLISKMFKAVVREEAGLSVKWDGVGKNAIKWSGGSLDIIDSSNQLIGITDLKTLPQKCSFEATKVYCAVPLNQSDVSSNDFDRYLKRLINFNDVIYLVSLANLSGNQTHLIAINVFDFTDQPADLWHLESRNGKLIFINRWDNKLYSLEL